MPSNLSVVNLNFNSILVVILTTTTILQVLKNIKLYMMMRINGNKLSKIYFKHIGKKLFLDLTVFYVLYAVPIVYMYIKYQNSTLVIDYIFYSFNYLVIITLISMLASIFTFLILLLQKHEEFIKPKELVSKSWLLTLFSYLILLVYVVSNYPISNWYNMYKEYNVNNTKEVTQEYYRYYYYDFGQKNVESQLEVKSLMADEMYIIESYGAYGPSVTAYLDSDYASLVFNYEFDNNNYVLGTSCDNDIGENLANIVPVLMLN